VPEEKPFDATPSRLARAKKDGDVPRSRDLAAVASFAAASLALCATFETLASEAARALRDAAYGRVAPQPYLAVLGCAAATVACAACGSIAASLLESGGVRVRFPAPSLAKLSPASGLRRIFGADALLAAGKAIVVALAVACAVVPALGRVLGAGGSLPGVASVAALASGGVVAAVTGATCVAVAFAAVDALVERTKWKRRLRMSFDELKREHKASEGDPSLRGRRRQAHRDLVRGTIGRVSEAAFVVANPTHVAVALAYRPPQIAVPCVLVRGIDAGALAIKDRARALGVPIVENVALARRLLHVDVDRPVPSDTYGAVAAIVAALLREARVS
jgi:flagellar biosynthesis protein FlhB